MALIRLLHQEVPGHYRIFTGAARALWAGQDPYGTDYGTGVGFWFYSPTCAMLFFQIFNAFPEKLGLALYMIFSWGILILGIRLFMRVFSEGNLFPKNLFWAVLSPQILVAILASKLEILMMGLMLIAASWVAERKRIGEASALLALLVNWKFQPLPTVGLLALVWVIIQRQARFLLSLIVWLGVWFAIPFLFLRHDFVFSIHHTWRETLSAFVTKAWVNFDNIFSFVVHALGIPMTYGASQAINFFAAGSMALSLMTWIFKARYGERSQRLKDGVLYALVLGSTYTVVFSPLNQNNALILSTPLIFGSLWSYSRASGYWKSLWGVALVILLGIITFAYSDLIPDALRWELRHRSVKSLACLFLGSLVMIDALIFTLCTEASELHRREGRVPH